MGTFWTNVRLYIELARRDVRCFLGHHMWLPWTLVYATPAYMGLKKEDHYNKYRRICNHCGKYQWKTVRKVR